MWALFTRALTLANSTVRVSVINTSTNFVITALMGAMVFGEELPSKHEPPNSCGVLIRGRSMVGWRWTAGGRLGDHWTTRGSFTGGGRGTRRLRKGAEGQT